MQQAWGLDGTNNGNFGYLTHVYADESNNIWGADSSNNRVQKFDPDGTWVLTIGNLVAGSGNNEFNFPAHIASSPVDNNIYIADGGNNRIQIYTEDGVYVNTIGGVYGSGLFNNPQACVVDSWGCIYVGDTNNCRIVKINPDLTFNTEWGGYGSGDGIFEQIQKMAVDSKDHIYVCDEHTQYVQKFDQYGNFVKRWGGSGNAGGKFAEVTGIACEPNSNNVYCVDYGLNRIEVFDSNGHFLYQYSMAPATHINSCSFNSLGQLYVSKFAYSTGAVSPERIRKFNLTAAETVSPVVPTNKAQYLSTKIDCTGAGDHILVAGIGGKTIRVHRLFFTTDIATTVAFKVGETADATGPMTLFAGGSMVLDVSPDPWFTTITGSGLVLNDTTDAQLSGRLYYRQD